MTEKIVEWEIQLTAPEKQLLAAHHCPRAASTVAGRDTQASLQPSEGSNTPFPTGSWRLFLGLTTKVRHSLPPKIYEYTKRRNGRLLTSTTLFAVGLATERELPAEPQ